MESPIGSTKDATTTYFINRAAAPPWAVSEWKSAYPVIAGVGDFVFHPLRNLSTIPPPLPGAFNLPSNNAKHFAFKAAGEAYAHCVNNVHGVPGAGTPHASSFPACFVL